MGEEATGATTGKKALAAALGATAARAAELMPGAGALVLSCGDAPGPARLRAAAGLSSPQQAREVASTLMGLIQDVTTTATRQHRPADPALGPQAAGGTLGVPLVAEGDCHGTLVVLFPAPPSLPTAERATQLAEAAALRIDYERLRERVTELERSELERESQQEEKSDEILRLSEALFAQDIELLQSQEKLSAVQKLKSDFIEKMSRELRTPLNSIIEAIISVLAGENEQLSEPGKESLRSALDEGTAFLRTLQNILDLWRLKQAALPISLQEVNFREVIDEAIFSVQDTIGDKPVEIRKRVLEPLPKVRTDLAKVNQILFLLLDNAAKFTLEGHIEIGVELHGDRIRCSIEDTGIGICADDREYIFDEFFQVDDTATTQYRGAGLGLTVVKDLLSLLGGGIELESEVGRGTRVSFEVPVQVV